MATTRKYPPVRRAINFDLNIAALKENYSSNNPKGAYKEIRSFFEKNGFFHPQGSGYCSYEKMTNTELIRITQKMYETFPWIDACTKKIDATNIVERYPILGGSFN